MKRVVLIHTVASLPASFDQLAAELLPGVVVEHVVDETLPEEPRRAGGLPAAVRPRFAEDASQALAPAPDAVVLTCSSVGPAADGLDVHRIDQAIAERAVELGARAGAARTRPPT